MNGKYDKKTVWIAVCASGALLLCFLAWSIFSREPAPPIIEPTSSEIIEPSELGDDETKETNYEKGSDLQ